MRRIVTTLTVISALLLSWVGADASTASEPTAVVAMGDSYIAGEGGRWLGNTSYDWADRRGTDRAAHKESWYWRYTEENVYGDSYASGCHRSDLAPIHSADLAVDAAFNLACSGAGSIHLRSAASGGESYRGEAPQTDQLAAVAAGHDVEVVVISVSGNDLDFSNVILDCVAGYVTSTRWAPNTCNSDQERALTAALPAAMAGVAGVLSDVRSVLNDHDDADARIILQGYPSPVAESNNVRYSENGWRRTFTGGCPFWDADLDWTNDSLIPRITAGLREQAALAGAEFLDLSEALRGHEACAATAKHGTGNDGVDAEWIRFVTTGLTQGDVEESLHPNAYGQRAMGRCIQLAVASTTAPDVCVPTPGSGPDAMTLVATGAN